MTNDVREALRARFVEILSPAIDARAPYARLMIDALVAEALSSPAEAVADEWQLVPKEPKGAVLSVTAKFVRDRAIPTSVDPDEIYFDIGHARELYAAILAASPQPAPEPVALPHEQPSDGTQSLEPVREWEQFYGAYRRRRPREPIPPADGERNKELVKRLAWWHGRILAELKDNAFPLIINASTPDNHQIQTDVLDAALALEALQARVGELTEKCLALEAIDSAAEVRARAAEAKVQDLTQERDHYWDAHKEACDERDAAYARGLIDAIDALAGHGYIDAVAVVDALKEKVDV